MKNKTMEELLCNESFLKKLVEAKTIDEVKSIFKEEGQEITDDQIVQLKNIFAQLAKMNSIKDDSGKMDDSDLENVSGGVSGGEQVIAVGIMASLGAFVGGMAGTGKGLYDLIVYDSKNRDKPSNGTQDLKEVGKFFLKIGGGVVAGAVAGGTAGCLI